MTLLSVPFNVDALRAVEDEPRPLIELRRAAGSPPQTTMRGHLRTLTEVGILQRHRQAEFPGSVDYQLGRSGRDLLRVMEVLEDWLAESPSGPLRLGTPAAKSVIKALVDGWSTAIVRALAAKPLSLTELSRLITGLSYPSLERRLGAMRLAGQIERCTAGGRGTPYRFTDWMRRAVAPLAAAILWERRHLPQETEPITKIDVEATFLLAVPLAGDLGNHSGVCRLSVESRNAAGEPRLVGVMVEVRNGKIASCIARLSGDASASASGSAENWMRPLVSEDADAHGLELGGDTQLSGALLRSLRAALLRPKTAASA